MENNITMPPEMAVVPTRQCTSYNPTPMMKLYQYEGGNSELYLEVKYRVDWFLHWCQENGVKGKIIESDLKLLPEVRMLLATCAVYMDDELAAESTTGIAVTDNPAEMNIAVQTAFTRAKGRALANLGFGTVNGNTGENGNNMPPDSGIPVVIPSQLTDHPMFAGCAGNAGTSFSNETTPAVSENPVPATTPKKRGRPAGKKEEETQPTVQSDPPSAPVVTAPAPNVVVADGIPRTVDEAKAFICPIGRDTQGKSLGHVMATAPNMVRFYASDKFTSADRHPGLVAAAKLLVEHEDF